MTGWHALLLFRCLGFVLATLLVTAFFLPVVTHVHAQEERRYAIAAAHPLAVRAGADILSRGGSAVDAMITVQLVLGLVEPQSSGIGGGGFMLYWNERTKKIETYDGREAAPSAATSDMFLHPDGTPIAFREAVRSGLSVGIPGIPALLAHAHASHGKLPWEDLFAPAIALAERGFAVSPRLSASVRDYLKPGHDANVDAYFFRRNAAGELKPIKVGTRLANPAYAATLRLLARGGSTAFYNGPLAAAIVDKVTTTPRHIGHMTLDDLIDYTIHKPYPLCAKYLDFHICGMGPPTSGGMTMLQILGMLEHKSLPRKTDTLLARHLIAQASRLAYADRGAYMADRTAMPISPEALLDPAYLKQRAAAIDSAPLADSAPAEPGTPPEIHQFYAVDDQLTRPSTTHFVIRDGEGNVISMTSSIEGAFGSGLMVGGFMLNNQLTDFSFRDMRDGKPIANAVAPGKRPRSSMDPTLIFDASGRFVAALGSPGGSRIIAYVTAAVLGMLHQPELSLREIFARPHSVNRNGKLDIEAGTPLANQAAAFRELGYDVDIRPLNSGLHGIRLNSETGAVEGAADPRREGIVFIGSAAR